MKKAPTNGREQLTEKQRRFVEAYMGQAKGNATEAARLAGYRGNDVTLCSVGQENLRKPLIRKAIDARVAASQEVADRKALQRFWTDVMLDAEQVMRDRLKASELLAKSQAVFKEEPAEQYAKYTVPTNLTLEQLEKIEEELLNEPACY